MTAFVLPAVRWYRLHSVKEGHRSRLHDELPVTLPKAEPDLPDNALAETINGLYKAELIHWRGPWRSFEAVEFNNLAGEVVEPGGVEPPTS